MAHGTRSGAAVKKLVSGPGFNHLVAARHGYVLHNVNDRYVGRSIERYGEWSPGETALFRQVLPAGALRRRRRRPHRDPHARLRPPRRRPRTGVRLRAATDRGPGLAANVALNCLTNVHTHHLGVGAENGTLQLPDIDYSRKHNSGGVSLEAVARPASDPHPKSRVTVVRQTPRFIYEKVDCGRGDIENRIKELHDGLQIDRTSCSKFWANQLRVLLTAAAYVLMQELRLRAARTACARTQVTWLRDRLLKLGAHVVRSVRRLVVHLPRATPDLDAWRQIALALGARAG